MTISKTIIFLVAIVVLVLIAYSNNLGNAFVWDDYLLIVYNSFIKDIRYLPRLFTTNIVGWGMDAQYYRPLLSLSFMGDYCFWKLNPFGYHLTNLFVHLVNTLLVFIIVEHLSGSLFVAFVASSLFAVHPVQVQAVTYIAGRADLLALFFILCTFLFYLHLRGAGGGRLRSPAFIFLFYLSSLAAFLSKEITLVFPFILVGYELCFPQGASLQAPPRRPFSTGKGTSRVRLLILALFAMEALYILGRQALLPFSTQHMVKTTLREGLINAPRLVFSYLAILFYPLHLHMGRQIKAIPGILSLSVLGSLIGLLVLLFFLFRLKGDRVLVFFSLWFFLFLLPVLNLFVPLVAFIAEHWLYIPSVGFFAVVGLVLERLRLGREGRKICLLAVIAVLALLTHLTLKRNEVWRDEISIFQDTLHYNPDSPKLHTALGVAWKGKRMYNMAIQEYRRAISLDPDFYYAHLNLGIACLATGDAARAVESLSRARSLRPERLETAYWLALGYKTLGQKGKALELLYGVINNQARNPIEEEMRKEASLTIKSIEGAR